MPTEHEPKYLGWLNNPNHPKKSTRPAGEHSVENYLDWIVQEPNGIDGVFVLNRNGIPIVTSQAVGAGGHVDLSKITAWAGGNVAGDSVNELNEILHVGTLKFVDYTFERGIMRLFYLTASNGVGIVIGFIGTNPDLMGKLVHYTPPFANKIRDYL